MADSWQRSNGVKESSREIADAADLAKATAALHHLDAGGLQRRWRALVGGTVPKELGRPLALRILAYQLQAERLGDLDRVTRLELAAVLESRVGRRELGSSNALQGDEPASKNGKDGAAPSRPARFARPGTVLAREHGGVLHRVMVLDKGAVWNGRTYDSLSQVAFAITGTRWNGPRFFGLRGKPPNQDSTKSSDKTLSRTRQEDSESHCTQELRS